MSTTPPRGFHPRAWLFCAIVVLYFGSAYLRDWPMTWTRRVGAQVLLFGVALALAWLFQLGWSRLVSRFPVRADRSPRLRGLRSWAGLASILWMVGVYAFLEHGPDVVLPESPPGVLIAIELGAWLGVGLLLALEGLRCQQPAGFACATVAVCIFIHVAWGLVHPRQVVQRASQGSAPANPALEAAPRRPG